MNRKDLVLVFILGLILGYTTGMEHATSIALEVIHNKEQELLKQIRLGGIDGSYHRSSSTDR